MPFAPLGFVLSQALALLSCWALIPIYIPLATVSYVSWTALERRKREGKGW